MNNREQSLKCSIMRGGTSKGIFIKENELPENLQKRDAVIRAVFGSPDIRQIDGLGGADVLTSKLAIIGPASRDDADVDYTFAQVSIDNEKIDYSGNCGNISAAVGPYAIDEGMVEASGDMTTVRIHMKNTGKLLWAEVPTKNGKAKLYGDFSIDGVPGTGAKITLDWSETAGGVTGKLLPTGHVKDVIRVNNHNYEVTLVDAGNPLIFIKAESLGLKGTELPYAIEGNDKLMKLIEKIRGCAAVLFGLCNQPELAVKMTPYNPFLAIVSEAKDYNAINGQQVKAEDIDIVSRLVFMQRMHKAYPITGTIATGVAIRLPGSVVWDVIKDSAKHRKEIYIGHPSGNIPVETEVCCEESLYCIKKAGVYRTARRIMDGIVYLPYCWEDN